MTQVAITVESVSKRYRKGLTGYHTLREDLYNLSGSLFHLRKRREEADEKHIWALHDVSFQVEQGERVGIIGRNGSGKTTMLRLLAGITKPTKGKIDVRGRIGVLIEIMAGFHPELTGRENVFLNGAIMGMSRKEIKRKFDEIVAFSELESFIDTPIKRYSSGMNVRLGFAVAAHLDPEILLIDEVLAVGDAAFQQKCMGKMGAAAQEGRTVLFVSHNMASVKQLCPNCLWLDHGSIKQFGTSSSVADSYLQNGYGEATKSEAIFGEDLGKDFQLRSARLLNNEGLTTQSFECDKPIVIELICQVRKRVPGLYGFLKISRNDGTTVMVSDSHDCMTNCLDGLPTGMNSVRITIPPRSLGPGDYYVYVSFASIFSRKEFIVDAPGTVCSFHLDDSTSRRGNARAGFFSTLLSWETSQLK